MRAGLRERWPELAILLVGICLRVTMAAGYDVSWSYDYDEHLRYVDWFAQSWHLPPLELGRATYHPPLFYALAGLLTRAGAGAQTVALISVVSGCLRLGVMLLALERWLPERRTARLIALALAAVLPASVHVDGMLGGEGLSNLLAMIALYFVPAAFGSSLRAGLALGVALGLALLTKISALTLLAAIASGAALELARGDGLMRERARRLRPLLAALLVTLALSGWYFVHNARVYGKPFLTSFDAPYDQPLVDQLHGTPVWKRRPPAFFVGWSGAIFAHPYYPTALRPEARFWPVQIASTFVDYYNYAYAAYPPLDGDHALGNYRPLRRDVLAVARVSLAAGTLIALCTVVGFIGAWRWLWRRRDHARLTLLLAPAAALAGALHFATTWPFDQRGQIKGAYLQFAAPPLCACFGLTVAWLWSRPRARPLAAAALAALACVAVYSLYCRFT